jgi:citrate synthase
MTNEIKEVIGIVMGCPADTIPDEASPATMPEWDSLKHIELMLILESKTGVRIPAEKMLSLNSFRDIEAYITSRRSSASSNERSP